MASLFSALFDRMGNTPTSNVPDVRTREGSSDSTITADSVDMDPVAQSSQSTPPTSIGDSLSIASVTTQIEKQVETTEEAYETPGSSRSRRHRTSVATYNVKVLTGTAIHAPRKYAKHPKTKAGSDSSRRNTIDGGELVSTDMDSEASTPARDANKSKAEFSGGMDALDLQMPNSENKSARGRGRPKKSELSKRVPPGKLGRKSTSALLNSSYIIKKPTVSTKQSRKEELKAIARRSKRELANLADTDEFAGVEKQTVLLQVWSKGKLVADPLAPKPKRQPAKEAPQASKAQEPEAAVAKLPAPKRKEKSWLSMGLYAGQGKVKGNKLDWFKDAPENSTEDRPPYKPDGALPLPMWHGQSLLFVGRDFKLPFDICSPLPPGQPKPEGWGKTSSNRFIGDAAAHWKHDAYREESKCVCTDEYGCDEHCLNVVMRYECDNENCAFGKGGCINRSFAELQRRRKKPDGAKGNKYEIGVEVVKTADRGYGVRSNRCFEPGQIIVEYTGEIITEEECDRRMNEDYKNNDCYYLMSFDQHMIIDATKGSIARFVNHSCQPNCQMVKWIVNRKPRMALFAGDKPIMTGEELTYDYNFDPFSAKNVQECRCGSANCRGILGPRPKDVKPVKDTIKAVVKATVKAGKKRVMELFTGESADSHGSAPKRRKTMDTTSIKVANPLLTKTNKTPKIARKQGKTSSPKSLPRPVKPVSEKTMSSATKRKISIVKTYSKVKKVVSEPAAPALPERSSPRSKNRRSYSDYLVDDDDDYLHDDDEMDVDGLNDLSVRSSGRKRRKIVKEDSGTIHVLPNTAGKGEDDEMEAF